MKLSWDREAQYKEMLSRCKLAARDLDQGLRTNSINPELTRLEAFCRRVYQRDDLPDTNIKVLAPGQRPPEADFSAVGVELIAKHVAFDCSQWEPLKTESEIRKVPIEASFSTSVLHFRRLKKGEIRIALESNSSGFGVVPLLEPGDELILGTKSMDEADQITKTTYRVRTIPANWPDEFEITTHAIFFNGFQDQQVRGKDSDWCAMRVYPGIREASLAFVKPSRRMIRSIRKLERIEKSGDIDLGVPATFSRAAGERLPVQDWYVWPIDTDDLSKPTIYSMRWKLKPP